MHTVPYTLSYWNGTITTKYTSTDIIILDAITGSQLAILSGHTDSVQCITFSSDGTLLVSAGADKVIKLWDIQTGGVVRTFHGHTWSVLSASISPILLQDLLMTQSVCGTCKQGSAIIS